MADAQKPDLVFRRNGRVHVNRRGGASVRVKKWPNSMTDIWWWWW